MILYAYGYLVLDKIEIILWTKQLVCLSLKGPNTMKLITQLNCNNSRVIKVSFIKQPT